MFSNKSTPNLEFDLCVLSAPRLAQNIVDNRVEYPRDMEPGCQDLVRRLLCGKPVIRMGSGRRAHKDFEDHHWFR